jgi:hypothetical protein
MSLDDCLKHAKYFESYWEAICEVIIKAHKAHNKKLIENDVIIPAPECNESELPWDESELPGNESDYYAIAVDYHTCGCGKKVHWDSSNVNFLEDLTLDSIIPAGVVSVF